MVLYLESEVGKEKEAARGEDQKYWTEQEV
jgi:hypothetical protein